MLPGYDEYLPMLDGIDASLEEKKDCIDRFWNFIFNKAFDDPEGFEELPSLAEDKK